MLVSEKQFSLCSPPSQGFVLVSPAGLLAHSRTGSAPRAATSLLSLAVQTDQAVMCCVLEPLQLHYYNSLGLNQLKTTLDCAK